jgi:hypothetical protein
MILARPRVSSSGERPHDCAFSKATLVIADVRGTLVTEDKVLETQHEGFARVVERFVLHRASPLRQSAR